LGSFIVGSLIGILLAFVWPSPYRATLELLVGLNLYRSVEDDYIAQFAEVPFRNADDYKYWQMQQLEALALSDKYLDETLTRLMEEDVYWQGVSIEDFRAMLSVNWRNAGRWRLAAELVESQYAEQAVKTWRDVILEKTNNSISNAQQLYLIDLELQGIKEARLNAQSRLEQLNEIEVALTRWRETVERSSKSLMLDPAEREWLINLASQAAGLDQGWQLLLSSFPPPNATIEKYLAWMEQILIAIDAESEVIKRQLVELQQRSDDLFSEWEVTLKEGDGLAATLTIEKLSGDEASLRHLRPTTTAALVGGLIGLLFWGLITLLRISRGLES
jgi:hypothetical protein